MPKELDFSSFQCDCGHQLHFCEGTIWEIKRLSQRRPEGVGEGDDRHAVIFHKGEMIAIFCPKVGRRIPVTPETKPPKPRAPWTPRQGQFLTFIHLYTKLNRQPPAEIDLVRHFQITPPSAHQMIVTLHRKGLIDRHPGQPRSITLRVDPQQLPSLD